MKVVVVKGPFFEKVRKNAISRLSEKIRKRISEKKQKNPLE